jgi:hypothetical protein
MAWWLLLFINFENASSLKNNQEGDMMVTWGGLKSPGRGEGMNTSKVCLKANGIEHILQNIYGHAFPPCSLL